MRGGASCPPSWLAIKSVGKMVVCCIHIGSQGMSNGCPGLIAKIGIHQSMTGCALIFF